MALINLIINRNYVQKRIYVLIAVNLSKGVDYKTLSLKLSSVMFSKFICKFVAEIISCQMQSNFKGLLSGQVGMRCASGSLEHIKRLRTFKTNVY